MGPGIFQTGSPWGHLWRISMAVFAATWALAIAAALTAAAWPARTWALPTSQGSWACPGPRSTGTWGRAGNAEQRPRPTSPRPVWPLRRAMTSQTNPHGWTGDPEARWGAGFGDSAPAHRGFPGEHPVPGASAGEPVTPRGKRALTAGRSIPRETPALQIRRRSAETLDETIPGSHHFRIH